MDSFELVSRLRDTAAECGEDPKHIMAANIARNGRMLESLADEIEKATDGTKSAAHITAVADIAEGVSRG